MSHKSELCRYDSAVKHGFNSLRDQESPWKRKELEKYLSFSPPWNRKEGIVGALVDFCPCYKTFCLRQIHNIKVNFIYYALRCKRGLNSRGRQPISFPRRPFFSSPERQPVPGSQIVQQGRIKTSTAKIRRALLVFPQPPRVFRISFY